MKVDYSLTLTAAYDTAQGRRYADVLVNDELVVTNAAEILEMAKKCLDSDIALDIEAHGGPKV